MDNIDVQVDSILENSLVEYYKASDLKGLADPRDLTDKEKEAARALLPTVNVFTGKGGTSAQSLLAKAGVDNKLKTAILRALKADFEEAGFNPLEEAKRETVSLEATIKILDRITDPVQKVAVQKALITFLRKSNVRLDSDTSRKLKTGLGPGVRPVGPAPAPRAAPSAPSSPPTTPPPTRTPTARSPRTARRPARSSTATRTRGTTPLGYARNAVAAVGNLFRRNENVNENRKPADDLVEIVIDFEELKKQELNESFLAMFGGWVEQILGSIFTGRSLPLAVKGSSRDVKAFAKAIGGEKDYIEAARKYGLDHPTTYKNKAKLNNAIKGFEKDTGLKWPYK